MKSTPIISVRPPTYEELMRSHVDWVGMYNTIFVVLEHVYLKKQGHLTEAQLYAIAFRETGIHRDNFDGLMDGLRRVGAVGKG